MHHISGCCEGEFCTLCGNPATHKVGEEIMYDDPNPRRHNFTAYVCCTHFRAIFGPAVVCPVPQTQTAPTNAPSTTAEPVAWIHRATGRLQRFAPRTEQVASWQPLYDFDRRSGASPMAWIEQHTDGTERVKMADNSAKIDQGWRRVTPLFGWGGPRRSQ